MRNKYLVFLFSLFLFLLSYGEVEGQKRGGGLRGKPKKHNPSQRLVPQKPKKSYDISGAKRLQGTSLDEMPAPSGMGSPKSSKPSGKSSGSPDISYETRTGNYPSWNTVKRRYWKSVNGGNVPTAKVKVRDRKTGEIKTITVQKELHHIKGRNVDDPHNFDNLKEVWPWEHEAVDEFRNTGYDVIEIIK